MIWQIAIGILAGFLAGKIMRGRGYGVLMDLLLGIVGSMLGGAVFGLLGLYSSGIVGQLVVATVGAILLIYIVRKLKTV
ncbi:MAG TPA: GlsB/YeaQ/YmgE family stress response membrane protein [Vicinamibacterales bacterium]|nr:GlsB/YeaQ/YmgE family stress response membrane protein [Vicinamibacterales bacterium]